MQRTVVRASKALIALGACALLAFALSFVNSTGAWAQESTTEKNVTAGKLTIQNGTEAVAKKAPKKVNLKNGHILTLRSVSSKKFVDVKTGSKADGASVVQWSATRDNNQLWRVQKNTDGSVKLISVNSGKALAANPGASGLIAGVSVVQKTVSADDTQNWIVSQDENKRYIFACQANDDLVLSVADASKANGAKFVLTKYANKKYQCFTTLDVTNMRKSLKSLAKTYKKSVKPGNYVIASRMGHSLVATVSKSSADDGALVLDSTYTKASGQVWKVSYGKDGFARIQNSSGKYLDVAEQRSCNGARAVQWTWNNGVNQKWILIPNSDGSVTIQSGLWKDVVLDVDGSSKASGARIQLYTKKTKDASNQRWVFLRTTPKIPKSATVSEGWYNINPVLGTNLTLNVSGGKSADGTNVDVWTANKDAVNQLFQIKKQGKYYRIIAGASDTAIEIADGSIVPCANARIYGRAATDTKQLYSIVKNSNGSYSFINVASGLALSLGGSAKAGTNVNGQVYRSTNEAVQFNLAGRDGALPSQYIEIASAMDSRKAVSVAGNSTSDGAQSCIRTYTQGYGQKWLATAVSKNVYTLESLISGKKLTASPFNTVTLESESNVASIKFQRWQVSISKGAYIFKNVGNGMVLTVDGAKTADNTSLKTMKASSTMAQRFTVNSVNLIDDGAYTVQNDANLTYVLDVAGASTAAGANVCVTSDQDKRNQTWLITHTDSYGESYYKFTNLNSLQSLDVSGGAAVSGTNVIQYESNDNENQWWIVTYKDGRMRIASKMDKNLVLTTTKAAANENVSIMSDSSVTLQRWKLVKVN